MHISQERTEYSITHLSRPVQDLIAACQPGDAWGLVHLDGPIFAQSGMDHGVLVVVEGLIQVVSCAQERSAGIELLRPGSVFGLELKDWRDDFPKTLEPFQGTRVCGFSRAVYEAARDAGRLPSLESVNRDRVRNLTRRASWAHYPVAKRVRSAFRDLVSQSEEPDYWMDLPRGMSQEQVATYVGSCRETVSRMFADLKTKGYLRKRDGCYQVRYDLIFPPSSSIEMRHAAEARRVAD